MEIIEVVQMDLLPLDDGLTTEVNVVAVVDLLNDGHELLETSFEYVPTEWPTDERIEHHTGTASESLTRWLEALRSNPNDWNPIDDTDLMIEYS